MVNNYTCNPGKKESDQNYLEKFACAKRDSEAKGSILKYFALFYFFSMAVVMLSDLLVEHQIRLHMELFIGPLFFAFLFTFTGIKKIRCYWIDYQNNIIADMGGEHEIIPFLEIIGVEKVEQQRSVELVKSFKVIRFSGTYQTTENRPVKVYASSRGYFVLIKTRTIPNYILSPAEPDKFVEFVTGRLVGK